MKKRNVISIICIALLLTGVAYLIVDKISARKSQERLKSEFKMKNDEIQRLEKETVDLKKTLNKNKESIGASQEKLAAVFGEETPSSELPTISSENENIVPTIDCNWINEKIVNFFSYLDKRKYIQEYKLKNDSYIHFKNIIAKLYEQKPMVSESKFPGDILKNTYHFYRTLRKENIILIKDIINKEKDIVEQTMDYFYQQQIHCENTDMILPPFDVLYEYSNFFLNTLGGKAYLFRLESRMRILLLYYTTMIIHEANHREINKYGIDLRPHVKRLENELNDFSKFYYSDKYLREIKTVKEKYPILFPVESS